MEDNVSLIQKKLEIKRLIRAFENQARKFHNIEFHTYLHEQGQATENKKFKEHNHLIMLWQYIGKLSGKGEIEKFASNVNDSNLKWGVRGAEVTKFGVIEGKATKKFVRMAKRAGALFNEEDALKFNTRVVNKIRDEELKKNPKSMPTIGANSNPLAIWLNYLLFYISKTYPHREHSTRIEPDVFTLSLLALERLSKELITEKPDKSIKDISKINFSVSVSFPGEKRDYVSNIVDVLRNELGKDKVFYDFDYQSQIARPNADLLLQNIYHKQSDLIVVFLCKEYNEKEWCGLEWRSIKDLIKSKQEKKIMLVKFDQAEIDGLFSTDGYIDALKFKEDEVAKFILERLELLD
ncbi:MAG: TIR domain-containing protein [Flavobacteriaceae bacterium]